MACLHLLENVQARGQPFRVPDIILITKGDVWGRALLQQPVECCGGSKSFTGRRQALDPGGVTLLPLLKNVAGGVCGAVIKNDELIWAKILSPQALQLLFQEKLSVEGCENHLQIHHHRSPHLRKYSQALWRFTRVSQMLR